MKSNMSEIIDLTVTQALERYLEMEPESAYNAIVNEWYEQMAVLLVEFFFKTSCGSCAGVPDFVQIPREHGDSDYIAPRCDCEGKAR